MKNSENDRFDRLLEAMVKGDTPSAQKKPDQRRRDEYKPVEKPE